jgi:DNA-binding NtrC family response regulator
LVHNAAQFANDEEAATTLFGVESNVFSGVVQRKGVIEEAQNGVLFLDETHNLPPRLQKSLLRVIENGEVKRIGRTRPIVSSVRFVLASNVEDETAGLVHDLYARMRVVRIPSLKQRTADIPSIFFSILKNDCKKRGVNPDPVSAHMGADHMEALCLDGFETENIRGLIDLIDRVVSNLIAGAPVGRAVDDIFQSQFKDNPIALRHSLRTTESPVPCDSSYEKNKHLIISAYQRHGGNISAVVRDLKGREICCSRRWLTHYIEKWGLRI